LASALAGLVLAVRRLAILQALIFESLLEVLSGNGLATLFPALALKPVRGLPSRPVDPQVLVA